MDILSIPFSLGLHYPTSAQDFSSLTLPSSLHRPPSRTSNAPASASPATVARDAPPPQAAETEDLPRYTLHPEPPEYTLPGDPDRRVKTVTKYLFILGFLFPVFWIVGAIMGVFPSAEPYCLEKAAWWPAPTVAEEQNVRRRRREEERKWSRRCFRALVVLIVVGLTVGITVWGGLISRRKGNT